MESKSKVLYLFRLLYNFSDEHHPISTNDIITLLKAEGIDITRKTVAANVALLKDFGIDVITVRASQNLYYVASREFELPEIKLLIDAVQSSKLITHKKSEVLISKLSSLASKHQSENLKHNVFIEKQVKPFNEKVYYYIDKIDVAILANKQVNFQYIDFTSEKEIVYKHDGQIYSLSPYSFAWNNDNYYIIGFSESRDRICTFRVDRLANVEISEKDAVPAPENYNSTEYFSNVFSMYDGEVCKVDLKCSNRFMKTIIDKFSDEVEVYQIDDDFFKVTAEVSVSPTFFAWLFQFGGEISILGPENVKDRYADMLIRTIDKI